MPNILPILKITDYLIAPFFFLHSDRNIKNYNKQRKKRRRPVQKLQSVQYQIGSNTNVITVAARACSCTSFAWYYTLCGISFMCVCLIARPVKCTFTLLPTWNCIAVKTCVSHLPCTICIRVKTNPMFFSRGAKWAIAGTSKLNAWVTCVATTCLGGPPGRATQIRCCTHMWTKKKEKKSKLERGSFFFFLVVECLKQEMSLGV